MRTSGPAAFYLENARWLGAGFALTFASSFGQTFFISLFAGEIRAVWGLSDGEWGALYTAATLGSALLLLQAGALADRVRADRLAPLVLLGAAAAALAMAAGPWLGAPLLWLGATVLALRFAGQGMMGHIAITAMGRWFRARRGRAVAVAGLGFSLGEAALPALAVLAAGVIGWQGVWLGVAGLLALLWAPLAAWLFAEGRRPRGAAEAEAQPGLGGRHWRRAEVLGHWLFWAILPLLLATPFIGTVLFFHQVHVSGAKGWPLAAMAAGYPVYAALTVAASLAGGWVVDRAGPARLLAAYLLPIGAGMALLSGAESVAGWLGVLALTGLSQGMAQALWGALWPELYGTRHLGAVRAMGTTAMVVATAAGPGITGLLIDAGVAFPDQALWLALACLALSGLGAALSRAIAARRTA